VITYNTLIVLVGVVLLGTSAGTVGSFAVLRRRALLGDALSHAALPGLCLGFLAAGERNLPAMLLGALATGLIGIVVIAALRNRTRVREDAAIGIVLSVFFGAGIVLSRLIQNSKTVVGSKAGLDSYILGKTAGMVASDVALIAGAAAVSLGLVALLFKEFLLISFDPGFARVQRWPAQRIDLTLTGLLAVVVVIGLPAVGVVMIAALLIIPGVSARFWTDRLARVVVLAALMGAGMGLIGTSLSATYDKMPAGPIIALVGTGFFLVSALAAPRRGLITRILTRRSDRWQADYDELLRLLNESEESGTRRSFGDIVQAKSWSPGRVNRLLSVASRSGDVIADPSRDYALTEGGQSKAIAAVRRYRLWRLLVTEYPDLASLARPQTSDPVEDVLPEEVIAALTARLRALGQWPESTSSLHSAAGGAP
jgi:manganese/zinc/iron transport system permease protein